MISIEINPEDIFPSELLQKAAQATLDKSEADGEDITIVLSDNDHIQSLNREFLGRDAPTDVLAFPADEIDPETQRRYLGDVAISLPYAREQAAERGHSVESEVQLLVVHGVLHLLGHDHANAEEKSRMWKLQGHILETLGISPAIVHEKD